MADQNDQQQLDRLFVRGALNNHRVALSEGSKDHPNGEAYVVHDGRIVEVARTARVAELLKDGTLVEMSGPEQPGENAPPPAPSTSDDQTSASGSSVSLTSGETVPATPPSAQPTDAANAAANDVDANDAADAARPQSRTARGK